ncbi:hypothetical protein ACJX0J_018832, partial [Zea mays]
HQILEKWMNDTAGYSHDRLDMFKGRYGALYLLAASSITTGIKFVIAGGNETDFGFAVMFARDGDGEENRQGKKREDMLLFTPTPVTRWWDKESAYIFRVYNHPILSYSTPV